MANLEDMYCKELESVLTEISNVLSEVDDNDLIRLINDISNAEKVFVIGVGRVLLSLQAFVKRLNHIGIKAYYVGQIDEPHCTDKDLLIVGSGSGNTLFPVAIAKKAHDIGTKVVHIGSNRNSDIKDIISYMIRIPTKTKLNLDDEIESKQIMTSLFEQSLLILGDIICKIIVNRENINIDNLWQYHANLE